MALMINTNLASLNAQRNQSRTQNDLSTAIARLSSGLRINTAVTPIELIQVDEGATYTDILPSLNLFYDLDRHDRIRFALAKA